MISRRGFLASTSSVVALCAVSNGVKGAIDGSGAAGVSPTVINFGGADPQTLGGINLNLAKQWQFVSSQASWPALFAGIDSYPSGNFTAHCKGDIWLDPTYYGRYILSWTDTGGTGTIGDIGGSPTLVYSGGNGTATVFGVSPAASGGVPGNMGVRSGGKGANIEFSFGLMLRAVGTSRVGDNGGAGLLKFTTTGGGFAGSFTDGTLFKFLNITGLASGPWSIFVIDRNHFSLAGSSGISAASVGLNTSGVAGTNTEAIYAPARMSPSIFGNWTGAHASNLIICKKGDLSAIQAGTMIPQNLIDAFKGTNGAYIRFMDISAVQRIQNPDYAHRMKTTSFSWLVNPDASFWGGTATNSGDMFTVSNPAASAGYGSGGYVDGEIVIAQIGASGHNTTQTPRLQITGRTGSAPIYTAGFSLLNLTAKGTMPVVGTALTVTFTGAGLVSPRTVTYTTTSGDTDLATATLRLQLAIRADRVLTAAGIYTENTTVIGTTVDPTNSNFAFYYNQNVAYSGGPVAQLGAGLSIVANDPTGAMTFTIGRMAAGYIGDGTVCTFTYNKLMQGWICSSGDNNVQTAVALNSGPPLEFYGEFCSRTNMGMWHNIPITSSATTIYNTVLNLAQQMYGGKPAIKALALEWGNETWLGLKAPTRSMGAALGFRSDAGADYSFHGLRTLQMAQQATAAWAAAGRSRSELRIVNATQFGNLTAGTSSASYLFRWNGGELNCSGSGTNVTIKAFGDLGVGPLTTNFSASPNRPIDWCDWISIAPYWQGIQFNGGFGNLNLGVPLSAYNGMLLAAYNYAYGNSTQQQAALDFLSDATATNGDLYNTATFNSATRDPTYQIAAHALGSSGGGFAGYCGTGTLASNWDSSRASNGTGGNAQLKVGVACYEGGWFMGPQSPAHFFNSFVNRGYTNGYSAALPGAAAGPPGTGDTATTAANNCFNLMIAWKNDARCFALITKLLTQFKASTNVVSTRESLYAWYGFQNQNNFSLYPGLVPQGVPFQAYNAIAAFR